MPNDTPAVVTALTYVADWLHNLSLPPAALLYVPPPALIVPPVVPAAGYMKISDQLPHWHCVHHISDKQLLQLAQLLGRTL